MATAVGRVLVGGLGVIMILGSLGVAATGATGSNLFSALFLFVPGVVMVAAVFLERTRYRSLHHEQTGDGHGPGGGETARPDGRFRPTEERFVDPTTNVAMQVWIDPSSGERRYVPLP
jgi:hypothetical protein